MKEAVLKLIQDEIDSFDHPSAARTAMRMLFNKVSALPEQGAVLLETLMTDSQGERYTKDQIEKSFNAGASAWELCYGMQDEVGFEEMKTKFLSSLTPVAVEVERTERAYNFSRDYEALYYFLLRGNEPVAIVDYIFHASGRSYRDVCRIRRHNDEIVFGVRGMEYGNVGKYESKNGLPQVTNFVDECKRMNLEWIDPKDSLAPQVNNDKTK